MESNMEKIYQSDFKGKSKVEIIEMIMEKNNGYITSKELDNCGIHRMYLNSMWKKGIIERVGNGIYIDSSKIDDPYYIFNLTMSHAIFSHMTALYFYGLSLKAPNGRYDITIKKTYNNEHLKEHEVFYVSNDIYELGLSEVKTPMGNMVRVYDIERCICDIIRSKKRMDFELVKFSVREYIKRRDKDLVKLSNYAEKLGIKDKVINFMEVFYE